MMRRIFTILLVGVFMTGLFAQDNTVGLISLKSWLADDGYTLLYPHNQSNVYLINNCGEVVHMWEGAEDVKPGNTAYLSPNGNLVTTSRSSFIGDDAIWAGGGGADIEVKSWDNEILSTFTLNNESDRLHHDIEVMHNGNILAISWEYQSKEDAIAAGRDSLNLPGNQLWPDNVIEIEPTSGEIVWEWHSWDHLIQDFDETKANFGVVGDHPELIDINFDTHDGDPDWLHANAIDYHPEFDQIMLSIPYFNEIWIIDHSTSTEEAATSSGGIYGNGGDLMYRWGNPTTYRAGDSTDQKLFFQHDAHWNIDHISPGNKDFGKVMVFNNRAGEDFSTANIFDPMFIDYQSNYMIMDGQFIPSDFDLTLTHPTPQRMYSTGLSSFQQLVNGNYLITVGRFGYTFEITPDNEIVWEYITPLRNGVAIAQGDSLAINNNLTFRSHKYPENYGAFVGKDLSAKGWIEENPRQDFCDFLTDINEITTTTLRMYPVPANESLTIDLPEGSDHRVELYSMNGQRIIEKTGLQNYAMIDVSAFQEGIYIVRVNGLQTGRVIVTK